MTFKPCEQIEFHLGYEPGVPADAQVYFKCVRVESSLLALDYALYRVQRLGDGANDDYPVLTLSEQPVTAGELLYAASFAGTFSKSIDRSPGCAIVRADPFDSYDRKNVSHACDTSGGSSGAPLIGRDTQRVVALHWGGIGNGNPNNHAVRMMDILTDIAARAPAVYAELQRGE